ncbi:MAG: GNAT family N-acetyltransferase [Verrucomicrobiota bacterium]
MCSSVLPADALTDLLVKLYELPQLPDDLDGVEIRRALAPERGVVLKWFENEFSPGWASEAAVAFGGQPIRCLVAVKDEQLLGAACFNTTFRGFFGPIGIREDARGGQLGKTLTIAALRAMREEGFAYAVIGATKAEAFFKRSVGAIEIPDSWPGAYEGMLPTREGSS